MEVLEQIFPKWSCIEILDKVAEGKHYDLMQKLNIEYHRKLHYHRKLKRRFAKRARNRLFYYLAIVYINNWIYYTIYPYYTINGKSPNYDEYMKYIW